MSKHRQAISAFQEGRVTEALSLMEELLAANQTSELWNDWAAMQLAAGQVSKAEDGFTRALGMDPDNTDASANLGLLLLGQGDMAGAAPLLRHALPALTAEQQRVVRVILGEPASEPSQISEKASPENRAIRVLLITDTFPDPRREGRDQRLIQMLRALREHGDEVTLIAREAINQKHCEPVLAQAGIQFYGNDSQRLDCLGREAGSSSWSLPELLERGSFDFIILVQSLSRGISVPEQYLDDLRRHSPKTPIAVLADELHASSRGSEQSALLDFEKAENWASRQWETFERADLVLVSEDDAVILRESKSDLKIEVLSHDPTTVSVAGLRQRILTLTPKSATQERCSVLLVETLFQDRLSHLKGEDRVAGQLECYVRLADQLLSIDQPGKAREQLRHIFGRLPEIMRAGYFASQVYIVLKRCYRKLGDSGTAERCAAESRRCVVVQKPPAPTGKHAQPHTTIFSVIVPTYNRLPILRKCLDALQSQTLAANDFEVIVIDDGSSDGTKELLSQYRPPFRFQYLRQANSGTGAARRNGLTHANGEYLLLMNDDTICDRDLLKEHLHVQRAYATERWAVLGNFEYPAAARHRALTRYFCVEPFMFPQVSMEEGCPYGYSHFITCNLSIRRDAVVEAGSFDSTYKLSEDTELGIRLYERGYRVLYHPEAHAFHDHLPYPARNLIRRARVYGADYFYMFGRHPRVMKEWAMPVNLTAMDEQNAIRILAYVEEHRSEVEQAVAALERWDSIDFEPLLADHAETALTVLSLFRQSVPAIHWFYLFETMLHVMIRELGLRHLAVDRPMRVAQGAGA